MGNLDKTVKNKHDTGMEARIKASSVFTEDESFPLSVRRVEDHEDCGVHSHAFHELVVILAGHGRHITESKASPLEAGDVFLIRGNMRHGYGAMDGTTLVNILFDPKRLKLPMALLRDLPGYHALFRLDPQVKEHKRIRSRLRLSEEELAEAAGMIVRLQREMERRKPGYRFLACAHLMSLIGFLSRCYAHARRSADRPLLRIGEVLSHIEQHYGGAITVRHLTRVAHMSESTLTRTFRRVLGRSPIEHVIRVRIQRAAEMLQQGDVRVTEAAFKCGFSDSNYFSRQFRKVMRTSPRVYRARHRDPAWRALARRPA